MKRAEIVGFAMLALFAGCDYVNRHATEAERADRLYREAMEEYAAGRLEKSAIALEKVLAGNPGNASARFQLACIQQDYRHDPMGAICNYREYTLLMPKGDKVKIARERIVTCERQLATLLVRKFDLGGSVAQDEANARLMADKVALTAELDKMKAELEKVKADLAAADRENVRVRRMVLSGADDAAVAVAKPSASKQAEKVPTKPTLPDEKDLLEEDSSGVDRVKFSADVENLIADEKQETVKSPFGETKKKVVPETPKPANTVKESLHETRPPYYVVQDGDTLYKIAMRFYGRRSAWSMIREANKTIISSDNRIRKGQKLRLP